MLVTTSSLQKCETTPLAVAWQLVFSGQRRFWREVSQKHPRQAFQSLNTQSTPLLMMVITVWKLPKLHYIEESKVTDNIYSNLMEGFGVNFGRQAQWPSCRNPLWHWEVVGSIPKDDQIVDAWLLVFRVAKSTLNTRVAKSILRSCDDFLLLLPQRRSQMQMANIASFGMWWSGRIQPCTVQPNCVAFNPLQCLCWTERAV